MLQPLALESEALERDNAGVRDRSFDEYLNDIRAYPLLTAEQEGELARRVQSGDHDARQQMIKANLRLVVSVAKDFLNRGMPMADMVSEGNIGLMTAVRKFDPERGVRFSSYAVHWIRQAIRRAITSKTHTVRVPGHMVELLNSYNRLAQRRAKETGHEPRFEDVVQDLEISAEQAKSLQSALRCSTRSLDVSMVHQNGFPLADDDAVSPMDQAVSQAEIEKIREMLEVISQRDAKILKLRYGIGVDGPMTLSEVGREMKLSRERVRQIESAALRMLQDSLTGSKEIHA